MTREPDRPTRIGLLYPGHSAEDDYPAWAGGLDAGLEVRVVHTTIGEDAHREDALRDTGALHRLLDGAARLRGTVDVAMWACTSGSFVFGLDGATAQAAALRDDLGVPVSSTSLAFASALRALGIDRVAIAASYPDDVAALFAAFLAEGGVTVERVGGIGIITGVEVGELGRAEVLRLVTGHDHPRAQAVLVPDTAMHTAGLLPDLEAAVGKPVLTANQVTLWEALRLAGRTVARQGTGALFERGTGAHERLPAR